MYKISSFIAIYPAHQFLGVRERERERERERDRETERLQYIGTYPIKAISHSIKKCDAKEIFHTKYFKQSSKKATLI